MNDRRDASAALARARARKSWPVRSFRLGEEPADNLLETTTATERLAMVGELTATAWALSGRPVPDYRRSEAPVRPTHLHEEPARE